MPCRLSELDPARAPGETRPTENIHYFRDLLIKILAGVVLGLALIVASQRHEVAVRAMLIPGLAIGYLASVIIHEAGHLIAAALQRFRICAVAVWPIHLHQDSSSWRIGWVPQNRPKGFISIVPIGAQR